MTLTISPSPENSMCRPASKLICKTVRQRFGGVFGEISIYSQFIVNLKSISTFSSLKLSLSSEKKLLTSDFYQGK